MEMAKTRRIEGGRGRDELLLSCETESSGPHDGPLLTEDGGKNCWSGYSSRFIVILGKLFHDPNRSPFSLR